MNLVALMNGATSKKTRKLSFAPQYIVICIKINPNNVSHQRHARKTNLSVLINGADKTVKIEKPNSVMINSVMLRRIKELYNVILLIIMPMQA